MQKSKIPQHISAKHSKGTTIDNVTQTSEHAKSRLSSKQTLERNVIHSIMNRAIEISKSCKEACRDFEIMTSPMHKQTLILRWITIEISNIDNPKQKYHYECFKLDGTPLLCAIHYSNVEEENEFYWSLTPLYNQQFAIDHTL